MSKINNILMLIMLMLTLTSCSMPETKVYTLILPAGENLNTRSSESSVSLAVHAPRYLEQPYIVHRVSQYQIEVSRYSKWDSSPSDMLKTMFRDALSPLFKEVMVSGYAPEGSYLLDITLRRFERTEVENVSFGELVFDVKLLSPDGKEVYKSTISKSIKLDERSNPALAKGLSSALSSAVEEVRNTINSRLNKPA